MKDPLASEEYVWKIAESGPNGELPDLASLEAEIAKLPDAEYEFVRLHLPEITGIEGEHRTLAGKPVRYIRAYDVVRDLPIERVDFYARKKHGVMEA